MSRVNAQEFAEKWARRLSAAGPDIQRGIERTTEAPGAAAVRNQQAMMQNTMAAIQSGKWARNTQAVSLQDWKSAAITKGVPRVAQGAASAQAKMARVAADLLPAVDAAAAKANNMPKVTIEDSVARAASFMRDMHAYGQK